jgi:hypothetical protein
MLAILKQLDAASEEVAAKRIFSAQAFTGVIIPPSLARKKQTNERPAKSSRNP